MSGVLVIGGEPGWVRGLSDSAVQHLFEGVYPLALAVEGVHEMHFDTMGTFLIGEGKGKDKNRDGSEIYYSTD